MSALFRDENERLVAEQAVLVYRSTVEAMQTAPQGEGLAHMEQILLDRGREHLRLILERAASGHAETQKKGAARGPVVAGVAPPFATAPRKR